MDSSATSSSIQFVDFNGFPIGIPIEWKPALIDLCIEPADWANADLRVQEVPVPLTLRRLSGQTRVLADWPRSGPGHYLIQLTSPAGTESRMITIQPTKISDSAYSTLLDDLQHRLPASIAIALQRLGGLGGLTVLPPAESTLSHELVRLRRAVRGTGQRPGLVSVLNDVATDPHRMLRMEQQWVPRERARRPHSADLARSITLPHLFAEDQLPTHVIDRRAQSNVDLYENRLIRLFTIEVQTRLRRLAREADNRRFEHVSSLATQLLEDLRFARRRASFLDDVSDVAYLPNRVTMVLLNRPPYRAAFEGFLELHRSLAVQFEDPRLDAPLENLPDLYQIWGTLEVIAHLLTSAGELGYVVELERLVHRERAASFVHVVPDGQVAVKLRHPLRGSEVTLTPERSFGSSDLLRSESFLQRPDITIEVKHPGTPTKLYLFDPKYKLETDSADDSAGSGRPVKTDIDKMHAYRDAIRDGHGRRVVVSAATLYPGTSQHYGPGIEAIQANPDHSEALQKRLNSILRQALEDAQSSEDQAEVHQSIRSLSNDGRPAAGARY